MSRRPAAPQTREELLEACRTFVAGDGDTFHAIVAATIEILGLLQLELAAYLKVTPPTVSRWASGAQVPAPRLQTLFVRDIARRVQHGMHPKQLSIGTHDARL